MAKIKIKKEINIKKLVTEGCLLNREIKEIEAQTKGPKKALDIVKKSILEYYNNSVKKTDSAQTFTLEGVSRLDSLTISESETVDTRKVLEFLKNDLEAFLSIVTITKTSAAKVLNQEELDKCVVKSTGNPTIRFK